MPDFKDDQPQESQAESKAPFGSPGAAPRKQRRLFRAKDAQPSSTMPAESPAAPGKKRHWVRRSLLTVLVLLIVIVALLPTLVSTGVGRGMIVSAVNDRILGRIAMQDLSLGWFGPCRVAGLEATDPQGRKILDVAQINWDRSLWNLLWSRQNLGKGNVDIRSVAVILTAEGSTSLQQAFAMREPSPPTPPKPSDGTFSPTAELNWTAAKVRVVQPDGREYPVSDSQGKVQAKTLNDILVDLSTTLLAENGQAKGPRLTVHAAVRDLFAGGNLNLDKASGTLSAKTDSRIAMKPILAFAAKGVAGQGDLGLDVTGNLSGGKGELKYSLDVKDLSAAGAGEKNPVPPLTAKLGGGADYKDKKLHGTLDFSGSTPSGKLGEIQSELAYDTSSTVPVDFAQIWDNLLKGQSVELPDFSVKIPNEQHLNLAEAIKSVPGLVQLRNGAKITGGDLKIAPTDIHGGASPAAAGGLTLLVTTAREGQPPQTWEPITVSFNVLTGADKKLDIQKADVDAPFAWLHGSGTPAKFQMKYNFNLDALRNRLNEVVNLDNIKLGGTVSGNVDTVRSPQNDKQIALTINAKSEGLVFSNGSIQSQGDFNLAGTGNLSSEHSDFKYDLGLTGLSYRDADQKSPAPPLNADLSGAADYKDKKFTGTLKLGGSTSGGALGEVNSKFAYDTSGKIPVNVAQIMDALMNGRSIELPDFSLDVDGHLNVGEVSKSVPGLVQLRQGVQIGSGDLKIEKFHVQGGNDPAAAGKLTFNLTPAREGQPSAAWEPITANLNALTGADKQFNVEEAGVKFGTIASIDGSGSLVKSHWVYNADLAALRNRLNEVLDLDKTVLGGKFSGSLDTARPAGGDKRIEFTFKANADAVAFGSAQGAAAAGKTTPTTNPAQPIAYSGDALGTANLVQLSNGLDFAGKIEVPKLQVSSMGEVLPNDHPVLGFDLALYANPAGKYDRLDIKTFKLESELLKANFAAGSYIDHLTTDMLADIKGDYTLSWPLATAMVKRLYPEGAKPVNMRGQTKYALVLKGPLTNPAAMEVKATAFPSVEGNTGVGWGNGSEAFGLTMGDANLAPSLANGKIIIPVAKIPANGGTLGLGGLVDLTNTDNPRIIIKDRLDVLDHVGLNGEVGHDILSMALPLLANVSELQGTVSLWVQGVDLPLSGNRILKEGAGRGHLDFSSVRLRPTGPMAQLMKLTGISSDALYDNVKFSPVDFTLSNGALTYDNFTLTLGQKDPLDLKFHGSVRFDGSVELFVSVPVKASLLSEFGFKDPTGQIAKVLDGERIEIPISGSRTNSRMDLSKVDLKPMVDQAIKKIGTGALLQGGPKLPGLPGEKPKTPDKGPTSQPANPLKVPGLFK